jgi:RNA polymerase sigma factor (sigma-70 family)
VRSRISIPELTAKFATDDAEADLGEITRALATLADWGLVQGSPETGYELADAGRALLLVPAGPVRLHDFGLIEDLHLARAALAHKPVWDTMGPYATAQAEATHRALVELLLRLAAGRYELSTAAVAARAGIAHTGGAPASGIGRLLELLKGEGAALATLSEVLDREAQDVQVVLNELVDEGWVSWHGDRYALTERPAQLVSRLAAVRMEGTALGRFLAQWPDWSADSKAADWAILWAIMWRFAEPVTSPLQDLSDVEVQWRANSAEPDAVRVVSASGAEVIFDDSLATLGDALGVLADATTPLTRTQWIGSLRGRNQNSLKRQEPALAGPLGLLESNLVDRRWVFELTERGKALVAIARSGAAGPVVTALLAGWPTATTLLAHRDAIDELLDNAGGIRPDTTGGHSEQTFPQAAFIGVLAGVAFAGLTLVPVAGLTPLVVAAGAGLGMMFWAGMQVMPPLGRLLGALARWVGRPATEPAHGWLVEQPGLRFLLRPFRVPLRRMNRLDSQWVILTDSVVAARYDSVPLAERVLLGAQGPAGTHAADVSNRSVPGRTVLARVAGIRPLRGAVAARAPTEATLHKVAQAEPAQPGLDGNGVPGPVVRGLALGSAALAVIMTVVWALLGHHDTAIAVAASIPTGGGGRSTGSAGRSELPSALDNRAKVEAAYRLYSGADTGQPLSALLIATRLGVSTSMVYAAFDRHGFDRRDLEEAAAQSWHPTEEERKGAPREDLSWQADYQRPVIEERARAMADTLGHSPDEDEWLHHGGKPGASKIRKMYGSWPGFMRAAHLTPKQIASHADEGLFAALAEAANAIGATPADGYQKLTYNEYREWRNRHSPNSPSAPTIARRLGGGSWTRARARFAKYRAAAEITSAPEQTLSPQPTSEDVYEEYLTPANLLEPARTMSQLYHEGLFGLMAVGKILGCSKMAVKRQFKKAGVPIRPRSFAAQLRETITRAAREPKAPMVEQLWRGDELRPGLDPERIAPQIGLDLRQVILMLRGRIRAEEFAHRYRQRFASPSTTRGPAGEPTASDQPSVTSQDDAPRNNGLASDTTDTETDPRTGGSSGGGHVGRALAVVGVVFTALTGLPIFLGRGAAAAATTMTSNGGTGAGLGSNIALASVGVWIFIALTAFSSQQLRQAAGRAWRWLVSSGGPFTFAGVTAGALAGYGLWLLIISPLTTVETTTMVAGGVLWSINRIWVARAGSVPPPSARTTVGGSRISARLPGTFGHRLWARLPQGPTSSLRTVRTSSTRWITGLSTQHLLWAVSIAATVLTVVLTHGWFAPGLCSTMIILPIGGQPRGTRAELAELDDSALIQLVNQRHQDASDAFAVLYRRHVAAAYEKARSLTSNVAIQDDVVADAVSTVYAALLSGAAPEHFRAYLNQSVRHTYLDHFRQVLQREAEFDDELVDTHPLLVDPARTEDDVPARLAAEPMMAVWQTLPERWRQVLALRVLQGLSAAEAAPLLGLGANAGAALLYRVKAGLRTAFQAELDRAAARNGAAVIPAWVGVAFAARATAWGAVLAAEDDPLGRRAVDLRVDPADFTLITHGSWAGVLVPTEDGSIPLTARQLSDRLESLPQFRDWRATGTGRLVIPGCDLARNPMEMAALADRLGVTVLVPDTAVFVHAPDSTGGPARVSLADGGQWIEFAPGMAPTSVFAPIALTNPNTIPNSIRFGPAGVRSGATARAPPVRAGEQPAADEQLTRMRRGKPTIKNVLKVVESMRSSNRELTRVLRSMGVGTAQSCKLLSTLVTIGILAIESDADSGTNARYAVPEPIADAIVDVAARAPTGNSLRWHLLGDINKLLDSGLDTISDRRNRAARGTVAQGCY